MPARVPKLFRICAASGRESMSERVGVVLAFTFRRGRFRPSCAGSALTNRSNIDVACGRAGWTRAATRLAIRTRAALARRLGWTASALALLVSTGAGAAQPTAHLSLTWEAPADCPTRDAIHARVDALLGGNSSASNVADVQALGQIERVGSGFRLKLSLTTGDRPTFKELDASTCDELAGAAAIAIALLARSGAPGADATGAAGSPANSRSATNSAAPTEATAAKPEPPAKTAATGPRESSDDGAGRTDRLNFLVDAPLGVVGWGSLPSLGLGVGAAVGVRWKALRVVAGGELWRTQTLERSGFSMRFGLQSGRAEACLTQDVSGVEVGQCVGLALERLSGRGVSSQTFSARSATLSWVSGSGGIMAAVPVPGFSTLRLLGQATVRVPMRRPRFVIDQLGPVHQPSIAAPKLDFGCGWIF
jgi:hypothetical protein